MKYESTHEKNPTKSTFMTTEDLIGFFTPEDGVQEYEIKNCHGGEILIAGIKLPKVSLRIIDCEFKELRFSECEFLEVKLTSGCEIGDFGFISGKADLQVECNCTRISIKDIEGAAKLTKVETSVIRIYEIRGDVHFQSVIANMVEVSGSYPNQRINQLYIMYSKFGSIELRGGVCNVLMIQETDFKEEMVIVEVGLGSLSCERLNLINSYSLFADLRHVGPLPGVFSFYYCEMGNLKFSNCDFEKEVILDIEHSNFERCKSIGSKWTTNFRGDIKNLTFGYFEIRKMFLNSNEFELAEKYWSLGMSQYFQQERRRLKEGKGLTEKLDFWVKIGLPWYTSRFGKSFIQPFLILFSLHIILTLILIAFQGKELGVWFSTVPDWEGTLKGIELWTYTILPTHRLSFNGGNISPIFSLVMRIVSGVLIYQMVLASRKHIGGK